MESVPDKLRVSGTGFGRALPSGRQRLGLAETNEKFTAPPMIDNECARALPPGGGGSSRWMPGPSPLQERRAPPEGM